MKYVCENCGEEVETTNEDEAILSICPDCQGDPDHMVHTDFSVY